MINRTFGEFFIIGEIAVIGDKDLALPSKMLDLLSASHKLTAHNLANAEVPGFRPLEANFEAELRRAVDSGDPDAIRNVELKVKNSRSAGVDNEIEVARMSKNEMLFSTFAEIASFKLRMLRTAVTSK